MLAAYELVSRNQTAFARRERLYPAGCPVTRAMISQFGGVLHKPRIGIKVKCPISEHALIPNNSDNKVNYEAQIELNLFVRLSNTVSLALQYDDNDFIVAHFLATQSAWILRHSK